MDIAYMVALVLVLGGGDKPETRIVPQGIVDQQECAFRTKTLNDVPPTLVDAVTGRKVMSREYVCVPVSPTQIQTDLAKLK